MRFSDKAFALSLGALALGLPVMHVGAYAALWRDPWEGNRGLAELVHINTCLPALGANPPCKFTAASAQLFLSHGAESHCL